MNRSVSFVPRILTILAVGLTLASTAEATTIYQFEFKGGFEMYKPDATTPNTTASDFQFSDINACLADFGNPGWTCGGAGAHAAWFTVTPNAGYSLNITGFSFDELLTAAGATRFDVFTSIDGFTSSILGGNLAPSGSFTNHSVALSLFGVTDPFTVRLVASGGAPGQGGFWSLDNVTLNVEAVPVAAEVPEPATLLLLGSGLAMAAIRRRSKV
jgi:hypothetical protein